MRQTMVGSRNPAWKGGRYVNSQGYVMVYCPDHPRVIGDCYVQEHTLVAEAALGKYLPRWLTHGRYHHQAREYSSLDDRTYPEWHTVTRCRRCEGASR